MKIQEVSNDTLKLQSLFASAAEGENYTYKEIEDITGVTMNNAGKGYMRTALSRLKLPYETTKGIGITLLAKDNALRIVVHKVVKVDRSIRKAEKTNKQVTKRMYDQLSEIEQKHINFIGASLGTVLAVASKVKSIFSKENLRVSNNL